jgi:cytochrome b561
MDANSTIKTAAAKASLALRGLHWLMALAIVGAWALIYADETFVGHFALQKVLTHAHILVGLSVLVLVPLRLLLHWIRPLPPIVPAPPRWQLRLQALVHVALYGLMLATPTLGLLVAQSSGRRVEIFGVILPALIGRDIALSHAIEAVHENLALALLGLVALHAAAAIAHHLVTRDNTLRRMI